MDIGDFLREEVLDPAADFSLLLDAADSDLTAVWSDNTEAWLLKHVTENMEDVTHLHNVLTHKLAFPITLAVCSHILFLSFSYFLFNLLNLGVLLMGNCYRTVKEIIALPVGSSSIWNFSTNAEKVLTEIHTALPSMSFHLQTLKCTPTVYFTSITFALKIKVVKHQKSWVVWSFHTPSVHTSSWWGRLPHRLRLRLGQRQHI